MSARRGWLLGLCALACTASDELPADLDLADPGSWPIARVLGARGDGVYGLPVAGGRDVDGDGLADLVHAAMRANDGAGEVSVVHGGGRFDVVWDLAVSSDDVRPISGAHVDEAAGSEVWVDDVTGDGLADVLVARQNHSPAPGAEGVGALSIVVGGAGPGSPIELALGGGPVVTLVGAQRGGRLGIWMRTGDVDGDGIADLAVGADGEGRLGEIHRGAVYVVRGGSHLPVPGQVSLVDPTVTPLAGHVVRLDPPLGWKEGHFGATVQVADLDGDGRAEVLVGSALHRAGASLVPPGGAGNVHADAGLDGGRVHVVWGDAFGTDAWPTSIELTAATATQVQGPPTSRRFGEELLADADFDGDGAVDLFVGDIIGDPTGGRPEAGAGYVLFDAARLRTGDLALSRDLAGVTEIVGVQPGALSADTAMAADFDGDGRSDLVVCSPDASPAGRLHAGQLHVLYGAEGGWPAVIDLAAPPASVRVTNVWGARGRADEDEGDTLGYSGTAGDFDGDGVADLIVNEMNGNGREAVDVGNLLVISGVALSSAP